ncbi:hypothetical protein N1851_034051 [Merluccius polli]|uniref:Uncharacterized protein n=1 Tax=Merluccius polli TaxID=89951 RepID=A0AA47M073_MERPO|nr:hypothetical protein N1851_034051 [Merluccius polli]
MNLCVRFIAAHPSPAIGGRSGERSLATLETRYRFTSQSIIYIHNLIRPYICNITNRSHALTSQQILVVFSPTEETWSALKPETLITLVKRDPSCEQESASPIFQITRFPRPNGLTPRKT